MKRLALLKKDKTKRKELILPGIKKGKGRDILLNEFRLDPELVYIETNVRRYTVSDIYAGRLGQAI